MIAALAFHLLLFVLTDDGTRIGVMDQGHFATRFACEQQMGVVFNLSMSAAGKLPNGSVLLGAACKTRGIDT